MSTLRIHLRPSDVRDGGVERLRELIGRYPGGDAVKLIVAGHHALLLPAEFSVNADAAWKPISRALCVSVAVDRDPGL